MKKAIAAFAAIWLAGCIGIFAAFSGSRTPTPDAVAINDAIMDCGGDAAALAGRFELEYERMDAEREKRDFGIQILLYAYAGILAAAGAWFYVYCERVILSPFRKMQLFARRIAAGDFDVPLEMDKNNLFGAFTESFDLMREELNKARENEQKADRSKKELVASLSHDIKTPVASIKAVSELMLVLAKDEKEKKNLETIGAKAEQINSLITDMFHSTLEELQALSVNVSELESTAIAAIVKNADYECRVRPFSVPSCIFLADFLRLQQIFDNIISNSYKYAGTDIEISAAFDESGKYITIDIADFGAGAPAEELPFLTGKFYRGKNSASKSGYGLGLYISKYLMEQMSGELRLLAKTDGFAARLMLRLA